MNFELTEEQRLLRDSVTRFVQDNYSLEQRSALARSELGFSQQHWQSMAELGWLMLPFAEADDGLGGNQIDTMTLFEQFGQGLVTEPYLASIVLGGGALRRGAADALRKSLFPGVMDGSIQLALGYAEEQARFDLDDVTTSARPEGDGFLLNGGKCMVLNAASADYIVVSARTSGGQIDSKGISLFLIDSTSPGVERENYPTVDGYRASEVMLTDVQVPADHLIGPLDKGYDILRSVINDGILALSAEAVGAMEILYKDTVAYTQERVQFDHPLSDFQVLQHRMVDMFMEYEQTKSLLYRATIETAQAQNTSGEAADSLLHDSAQQSVHALKHLVGTAGSFIGENAVQLHGGMGMTEELRIGHFFTRLIVIDLLFGDADYHLEKFAA